MGYMSNVKIKMGTDAYKLLKETCEASEKDYIRDMVKPSICEEFKEDGYVTIEWPYCKWYNSFEDVTSVNNVLRELDSIVEEDSDKLDTYFYKIIRIGEDNQTDDDTNDYDGEFTDDFYVECHFSI